MMRGVHVCKDADAVATTVAQRFADLMDEQPAGSCFRLGLSGGSTPRRLHTCLSEKYRERIDWSKLHVFWSDERCVAPSSDESNYHMAQQTLLARVPLPADQVYRVPAETMPPRKAAVMYTSLLQEHFRTDGTAPPLFDLLLLGMGKDGHTASLFPNHPALLEDVRWVTEVHSEAVQPPWRISFTLPLLRAARRVWFLVTGADKAPVMQQILHDPGAAATRFPAALLHTQRDDTLWFIDEATERGSV